MNGTDSIVHVHDVDEDVHTLVVRGPASDRLYDLFSRIYAARGDVMVVKERRRDERRRSGAPVAGDRRRAERRVRSPWMFPPE